MVRIGISTFHTFFLLIELVCKSRLRSHHFICYMGRDPRLPTTSDSDTKAKQKIDVDTYKGEMALKLNEAWGLAQDNIRSAQRQQKAYYDRQSRSPRFNIGDRVLVYMPAAKAIKAYKFARLSHGRYRIIEQSDTGVTVRLIDKP